LLIVTFPVIFPVRPLHVIELAAPATPGIAAIDTPTGTEMATAKAATVNSFFI
jgi:hypothetical protein